MKKLLFLSLLTLSLTACTSVGVEDAGLEDAATDLQPAPAFDLAAFPQGTLNSEDLKGKVVVIDFWATWCQPCIKEIPDLNALHSEQDPEKFAMIGVTIESGSYDDIAETLDDFGIEYPLVMGTEGVVNGFGGIIGFPTKFVVSPDWKIYKKYMGGNKKEEIERDIHELLGIEEVAQGF